MSEDSDFPIVDESQIQQPFLHQQGDPTFDELAQHIADNPGLYPEGFDQLVASHPADTVTQQLAESPTVLEDSSGVSSAEQEIPLTEVITDSSDVDSTGEGEIEQQKREYISDERAEEIKTWLTEQGAGLEPKTDHEFYTRLGDDGSNKPSKKLSQIVVPEDMQSDVALALIKLDKLMFLYEGLDSFKSLSSDVARSILDAGYGYIISDNVDKFNPEDFDASFVEQCISSSTPEVPFDIPGLLDRFPLNSEQMTELLSKSAVVYFEFPDRFPGVQADNNLQETLLTTGQVSTLINYSDRFPGLILDESFANRILESGYTSDIVNSLGKFSGLSNDFLEKLVKTVASQEEGRESMMNWDLMHVVENISLFPKDIQTTIVSEAVKQNMLSKLVNTIKGSSEIISQRELFDLAVSSGKAGLLGDCADSFTEIPQEELATALFSAGVFTYDIQEYLNNLPSISGETILIIVEHDPSILSRYLDRAVDVNMDEIQSVLIGHGEILTIVDLISRFDNLDVDALIGSAIQHDKLDDLIYSQERIPGLELDSNFVSKLIDAGKIDMFVKHSLRFEGIELSPELFLAIIEKDLWSKFMENSYGNFPPHIVSSVFGQLSPNQLEMVARSSEGRSFIVKNVEGVAAIPGELLKSLIHEIYVKNQELKEGERPMPNVTDYSMAYLMRAGKVPELVPDKELADFLVEHGMYGIIFERDLKFPDEVFSLQFVSSLMDSSHVDPYLVGKLASNISRFPSEGHQELFDKIFAFDDGKTVISYDMLSLDNNSFQLGVEQTYILLGASEPLSISKVLKYMESHGVADGLDLEKVFNDFVSKGNFSAVIHHSDMLLEGKPLDKRFVDEVINRGESSDVDLLVSNLRRADRSIDFNELADTLFSKGRGYIVLNHINLRELANFTPGIKHAQQLLTGQNANSFFDFERLFDLSQQDRGQVALTIEKQMVADPLAFLRLKEGFIKFNAELPGPLRSRAFELAYEMLGDNISSAALSLTRDILDGKDNPEALSLGITRKGEAGTRQLDERLKAFSAQIMSGEPTGEQIDQILNSPTLLAALKSVTRYENSGFGSHDDLSIKLLLDKMVAVKASENDFTQLEEGYEPSEVVYIGQTRGKDAPPIEWTEDAAKRYSLLAGELREIAGELEIGQGREITAGLIDQLEEDVRGLAATLQARLDKGMRLTTDNQERPLNDKEREHIHKQVDTLTSLITQDDKGKLPLRSLRSFQENFQTLSTYPDLQGTLRKIMFTWAVRQTDSDGRPVLISRLLALPDKPDLDAMTSVFDFVDHMVNQETFSKYFTDKKARNQFRSIINTQSLQDSISRVRQGLVVSDRTTPFQFMPSRGLLLELSGHIGDACWASSASSIAETYPNLSAVIIKQNPGDPKREKFAGSLILIETRDTSTGEPLLVLRGVNPLESVINGHDVEGFFESLTTYARGIAKARGMKLGVVISDESGQAGTNRPLLHAYMVGRRRNLQQVIVPDEETHFNRYDVTEHTYILPE